MKSNSAAQLGIAFAVIFAAVLALHAPLLRLPYFWDEAGYYIPAARDLFLTGNVIPHSTPSNAHPPLVMAYLAACWKIAGASIVVTRTAMLCFASFALLGVFRLAQRVSNRKVAFAATGITALYPVFFAQSSMAHVDLAAAGLTLWGLNSYLGERWWRAAGWFSLAALAKETAVLTPLALLGWEVSCPWIARLFPTPICIARAKWKSAASLLMPLIVLCLWYGFHFTRTGYVFGNPEFFRYNVQATLSPVRIVLALGMRLWQAFGYMHLWVLLLLMVWAMTRPPLRDGQVERRRIDVAVQCVFGILIFSYVVAMAIVGGAVLARYMLTIVPLVMILAVSTLWRRLRRWPVAIAMVSLAFGIALFVNPPYGFSPEDNLAYRDYIVIHEHASSFLESHYPRARVLTAWPASSEITQPYLGYVQRALPVVQVEDFTIDEVAGAAEQRGRFDVALVFSTKYQPPRSWFRSWRAWERIKKRFFGFHRDLPPEIVTQMLGGHVVFYEIRQGQWVAVIELERLLDAKLIVLGGG